MLSVVGRARGCGGRNYSHACAEEASRVCCCVSKCAAAVRLGTWLAIASMRCQREARRRVWRGMVCVASALGRTCVRCAPREVCCVLASALGRTCARCAPRLVCWPPLWDAPAAPAVRSAACVWAALRARLEPRPSPRAPRAACLCGVFRSVCAGSDWDTLDVLHCPVVQFAVERSPGRPAVSGSVCRAR